jgi:hypothetical protein
MYRSTAKVRSQIRKLKLSLTVVVTGATGQGSSGRTDFRCRTTCGAKICQLPGTSSRLATVECHCAVTSKGNCPDTYQEVSLKPWNELCSVDTSLLQNDLRGVSWTGRVSGKLWVSRSLIKKGKYVSEPHANRHVIDMVTMVRGTQIHCGMDNDGA